MELPLIVVALTGPVLLVLGFVGWWTLSGELSREEKIADALHRFKQGVDGVSYRTMMDLSRIRKEYGDNDRKSGPRPSG